MIMAFNREQVLCTNEQQDYFEAQQALGHAGIEFRTEVRDNTRRLLERQDVMGIRTQYPREYKIYVPKKDADMARHILKYGDNR